MEIPEITTAECEDRIAVIIEWGAVRLDLGYLSKIDAQRFNNEMYVAISELAQFIDKQGD